MRPECERRRRRTRSDPEPASGFDQAMPYTVSCQLQPVLTRVDPQGAAAGRPPVPALGPEEHGPERIDRVPLDGAPERGQHEARQVERVAAG